MDFDMKEFHLETLMGTVYRKGNLKFHSEQDSTLFSPVGNRITSYDLKKNNAKTSSVEASHNYTAIDVSPNGKLLLAGNETGEVHVISLVSYTLLQCWNVEKPIRIAKFSPDGSQFAIAKDNIVFLYRSPSLTMKKFNTERVYHDDATGDITCIDWSDDSAVIGIGSLDLIIRLYITKKAKGHVFCPTSLSGHSDIIVNAFFQPGSYDIVSISRDRQLNSWEANIEPEEIKSFLAGQSGILEDDNEDQKGGNSQSGQLATPKLQYKKGMSCYLDDPEKSEGSVEVTCADFNKKLNLCVTGYDDGMFRIYSCPDAQLIRKFSLSDLAHSISTVCFNATGDWIALGSATLGQLLVWDWKNEVYVLKQQGHLNTMSVCSYSPDGRHIVTGGQDGKVKVWETGTSFCFVTFTEHTSLVTGVVFTQNGNAVVSSSMDGTVRAFDLTRYRNFRTFTTPKPAQFSSVTVDKNGDFVAACAVDVFDIFLWSMKTGKLLEVLSGHEGPVTSVLFTPSGGSELASVSLDKTLRIWEAIENTGTREIVQLNSEGTCLAYKPDGEEIAVGTLDCHILFVKPKTGEQRGTIQGRNHLGAGILDTDRVSTKKNLAAKSFTFLAYSPEGLRLLASGDSKTICYYDVKHQMLLKKYEITQNKSLDGMNEFVHHKNLTEFGNKSLIINNEDDVTQDKTALPGVSFGDKSSRSVRPEVRVTSVCFSPSGMQWVATSTEGLLLYSNESYRIFFPIPIEADEEITVQAVLNALEAEQYDRALMLALHLNIEEHAQRVLDSTPASQIPDICKNINPAYGEMLIKFLAQQIGNGRHFQFYLIWVNTFLRQHLMELNSKNRNLDSPLNLLEKNMIDKQKDVMSLYNWPEEVKLYVKLTGEAVFGNSVRFLKKDLSELMLHVGCVPQEEFLVQVDGITYMTGSHYNVNLTNRLNRMRPSVEVFYMDGKVFSKCESNTMSLKTVWRVATGAGFTNTFTVHPQVGDRINFTQHLWESFKDSKNEYEVKGPWYGGLFSFTYIRPYEYDIYKRRRLIAKITKFDCDRQIQVFGYPSAQDLGVVLGAGLHFKKTRFDNQGMVTWDYLGWLLPFSIIGILGYFFFSPLMKFIAHLSQHSH